ncbi:MAG: 4'-phosphopantetheinyl transferase superfamily protein [Gammaproteobacteria bacterium]|nr:4'-phosphopantetheinyl transferase superfamily protein [Gammaproteobacteria bacterium]
MIARFPEIIPFQASPPPLGQGQMHLMVASLEFLATDRERILSVINEEEQSRAQRLINAAHRDNFRLVRGALRLCLEQYLGLPAETLRFTVNPYGKPEIDPAQNPRALRFNVSHSHQMVAFIFTLGKCVGIDIEFIKPLRNMDGLARHVCNPRELTEFNALDFAARREAFFRLWTRKEAFIKAKGQGLSMGLRSIYIGIDTNSAARPVQYRDNWLNNWLVKDLACDPQYKSAVAIET